MANSVFVNAGPAYSVPDMVGWPSTWRAFSMYNAAASQHKRRGDDPIFALAMVKQRPRDVSRDGAEYSVACYLKQSGLAWTGHVVAIARIGFLRCEACRHADEDSISSVAHAKYAC